MKRVRGHSTVATAGLALVVLLTWVGPVAAQGCPPEIVFVGFPGEVEANGMMSYAYLSFKNQDGDVAQVRIEIAAGLAGELQIAPGWVFDPGMTGKTSGTVEFTVATTGAGAFILRVTLVDAAGNLSAPKNISFTAVGGQENAPPVARFRMSPSSVEVGDMVTFDASSSSDPDGPLSALGWDFGDGCSASGQRASHVYHSTGTYIATLTVTDSNGASDRVSQSIRVTSFDINDPIKNATREEFTSSKLAVEWNWIRESRDLWQLVPEAGVLHLRTHPGGLLLDSNNARNLLLRRAPVGDFVIEIGLTFTPEGNFQIAGAIVYLDDDHYTMVGRGYCDQESIFSDCIGNAIYFDCEEGGRYGHDVFASALPAGREYFRLARSGTVFAAYYSCDREMWSLVGTRSIDSLVGEGTQVGIVALGDSGTESVTAVFDYFQVVADP